ncbi:MAG: bifunctional 3-(3-hydroxy-phenyl)propionate/3-hydroxycinnamic acid hydroxylase [Gammaproteobacteria bacterium]|nr:bifunctional 3-(3-hydroxy-phenyl)propionate/3-hydroxycinnamic acid hydroxylase [Gammaproteobacteria bacterium]
MSAPYDVIVLGLGPVGCSAAILLAHAGLKVAAFERDREVYKLPRAVNMDGEVIRSFQRIGLGEELNALMQPIRAGERVGFVNSQREWLFGQEPRPFGVNGWNDNSFFDQPEVDGFLRDTALAHPNVDAYIGYEVLEFSERAPSKQMNAVEVRAEEIGASTPGAVLSIEGSYLIGCDGASSFVRKSLNIGWHDLGYDHDWLVVDIISKPGNTLNVETVQICDPDRLATYVCTKDPYRRWEFKLNAGETWEEMLEPAKIEALIEAWTPKGTYEIRRAAMYQFHAATADTWRAGRIFIAGDAAHQTPPFLGQGMNAGMRDVINLCWKLPMVISGVAGDALLDSYQAERLAHATDLVEWAVSIGRLMEHLAAVEAAARAGRPAPEAEPAQQSSGYGQGRTQPPMRDGLIHIDQVSDKGSTGYLFRQPDVRDASGAKCRLDEILGSGFSIVARTGADLTLSAQSRQLLDLLGAQCVTLDELEPVRGRFDQLFERSAAAVVRPDRYVFGHTSDTVTLDALITELGDALALTRAVQSPPETA